MIEKIFHRLFHIRRQFILDKRMSKLGLIHAKKISTWTSWEELRTLHNQARLMETGCNALEIGSYLGASTCYIVAGLAEINGHLTCIDTWNNETMPEGERDTFNEFLTNIQPVQKYITTVRKDTSDLFPDDFPSKFDFAFIDGDHSYGSVRRDFLLVSHLTKSGSKVFFHDSQSYEGVTRVIGEALASGSWRIGDSVDNLFWLIKK